MAASCVTLNRFLITRGKQENTACSQNKNIPPSGKGRVTSYLSSLYLFIYFGHIINRSGRNKYLGFRFCVCLIVSLPQNGGLVERRPETKKQNVRQRPTSETAKTGRDGQTGQNGQKPKKTSTAFPCLPRRQTLMWHDALKIRLLQYLPYSSVSAGCINTHTFSKAKQRLLSNRMQISFFSSFTCKKKVKFIYRNKTGLGIH